VLGGPSAGVIVIVLIIGLTRGCTARIVRAEYLSIKRTSSSWLPATITRTLRSSSGTSCRTASHRSWSPQRWELPTPSWQAYISFLGWVYGRRLPPGKYAGWRQQLP
jgi:hypothetical protein